MNYEEYTPLALRTAKVINPAMDLFHAKVGIVGEIGELCDAFKKHYVYGKPLDLVNLKEELGDTFWSLVFLCSLQGRKLGNWGATWNAPANREEAWPRHAILVMSHEAGAIAMYGRQSITLQAMLEQLCWHFDMSISDVLETNIAKLAARYGDKYSDYAALNRDLTAERAVLES